MFPKGVWVLVVFSLSLLFLQGCVPVGCTEDAKLCPDGSSVGRVAPNCEFAPCPESKTGCTKDAKVCPDGSSVGRGPPNCEFAPCPEINSDCTYDGDKSYVAKDVINCATLKFMCEVGSIPFADDCGCGCEPEEKYNTTTDVECNEDKGCPIITCVTEPCPQQVCVDGKCVLEDLCGNNVCEEGEADQIICPPCNNDDLSTPCPAAPCELIPGTCPGDCPALNTSINNTKPTCTEEWAPVCGQPPAKPCADVKSCEKIPPMTYSNKCELEAANAKFLYDGECVGCPEDLKVCLDGTTLERSPPKCEFPECPRSDKVYCKEKNAFVTQVACLKIDKTVCGWFDPEKIQCVTDPCAETFQNSCFACNDDNVLYWTEGACPDSNSA